jgi:hypothetical protein
VLTPCLIDAVTGEILDTVYSKADESDFVGLKKKGWRMPWAQTAKNLDGLEAYKVTIKGDEQIQGLILIKDLPEDMAVFIVSGESAPHNKQPSKKYEGVGGHLTAIAIQRSIELGYNGFVYFDVKNSSLIDYYNKQFGAISIGTVGNYYRMYINEATAAELIKEYTLERQD